MSKEMEIEFKNILTEKEYLYLLSEYGFIPSDLKEQTNSYFDTKNGDLRQDKMGLRIRQLPRLIEFTLKVPTEDQHTYLEITDTLVHFDSTKSLTEQIPYEKSDVLFYLHDKGIPIEELENTGQLTTLRGEKQLKPGILLVLDKSDYYGTTDFELEMEVTNNTQGHLFFTQFLKEHSLSTRPAQKKIARMFERKNELE